MGRVYLQLENNNWKEVEKSDFWIHDKLYARLKALEMIQSKGWDGVIIVDGKERSGKSILGIIMGWYLSKGKLGLPNFCRGIADASRKIAGLPDKSVLIVDEASTVFSSKDGMSDATKKLLKIMDVVGQKNLIFILCLPCIFDLTKTIAVRRSLFLCHVYPDKEYNRGQYAYWGEKTKKELYIYGKKNFDSYKQPRYEYNGEYMDFKPPFYQEYLDIVKKESLNEVLKDAIGGDKKHDVGKAVNYCEGMFYSYIKNNLKLKIEELMKIKGQSRATIREKMRYFHSQNTPLEGGVQEKDDIED